MNPVICRWVIVLFAFLAYFVSGGISFSCGVMHMGLSEFYNSSNFGTSWVGSAMLAVTNGGGIVSALIVNKYGCRPSAITGGVMSALGWALSYFTKEICPMIVCIGILGGLGYGLATAPANVIVRSHFEKPNHFARRLPVFGIATGTIAFALISGAIIQHFTWRGAVLILGAISLALVICGAFMKPHQGAPVKIPLFDKSVFNNRRFILLCFTTFAWCFGSSIIYVHYPAYARSHGTSFEKAVFLIVVIGVSSLASRTVFTFFTVSAGWDQVTTFFCTIGISAVCTFFCPKLCLSFTGQVSYAILFGFYSGCLTPNISEFAQLETKENPVPASNAYTMISACLGYLLGAPMAGLLLDSPDPHHRECAFYLSGGALILASALLMLSKIRFCGERLGLMSKSPPKEEDLEKEEEEAKKEMIQKHAKMEKAPKDEEAGENDHIQSVETCM